MERGGVSTAYQQGFVVDKPSDNPNIYEPMKCAACGGIHFVNPKSRKVLGDNEWR